MNGNVEVDESRKWYQVRVKLALNSKKILEPVFRMPWSIESNELVQLAGSRMGHNLIGELAFIDVFVRCGCETTRATSHSQAI